MQVGGTKHFYQPIVILSSLAGCALVWLVSFVNFFMQELVDGASKQPLINSNILTLCNMMTGGGLICHAMKELYYFVLKFYVQTGA